MVTASESDWARVRPLGPFERFAKRGLDVAVAAVGLLLLGWLIGLAYLVAVADTRQNGFFIQDRIGLHAKRFRLLKIRTMRRVEGADSTVTTAHDPRVTRIGWFLRRTKIDELPQLVNVIKGDMSLVGPRPDVPEVERRLNGSDRIILSVRPGMTGPATLAFRREEDRLASQVDPVAYSWEVVFPQKVALNRAYVESYSVTGDIRIVWATLVALLRPRRGKNGRKGR